MSEHVETSGIYISMSGLIEVLTRIAVVQEKLLAIAEEARNQRVVLSDQMKKAFQQPLQENNNA